MDIQAKKVKEKYAHYIELVRDLTNNYNVKDEELLGLVDDGLSEQNYAAIIV